MTKAEKYAVLLARADELLARQKQALATLTCARNAILVDKLLADLNLDKSAIVGIFDDLARGKIGCKLLCLKDGRKLPLTGWISYIGIDAARDSVVSVECAQPSFLTATPSSLSTAQPEPPKA